MLPSKDVTLPFAGFEGLEVTLCYLSREELIKLRKKCVTTKFGRNGPEEHMDQELFLREFCRAVIKGWSGFKMEYLYRFLLVDLTNQDPEAELPFSLDNCVTLMQNSSVFDEWVTENTGNLENFSGNK